MVKALNLCSNTDILARVIRSNKQLCPRQDVYWRGASTRNSDLTWAAIAYGALLERGIY
jgi:hypothetical protein